MKWVNGKAEKEGSKKWRQKLSEKVPNVFDAKFEPTSTRTTDDQCDQMLE